ncbi:hypothetical protein X801_00210 [Opisthorchis viverrini]|uniref:Uncharacterized protein n=1 Tax=Opisthorchis viverrini TaxID=6198 RepID=A0A1S8XBR8_OPIVI|nr:hypothetical protein X801_00210 [Opisthorchis viverrini]
MYTFKLPYCCPMEVKVVSSETDARREVKIFILWRGVLARRQVRKLRHEELVWLGMIPGNLNLLLHKSNVVKLAQRVEAVRRVTQSIFEQEYQDALIKVKEKIRESEGNDMREMMQDQIRQWFVECRPS